MKLVSKYRGFLKGYCRRRSINRCSKNR